MQYVAREQNRVLDLIEIHLPNLGIYLRYYRAMLENVD